MCLKSKGTLLQLYNFISEQGVKECLTKAGTTILVNQQYVVMAMAVAQAVEQARFESRDFSEVQSIYSRWASGYL